MAYGRLASIKVNSGGSNHTVYTVPNNCYYAEIDLNVLNVGSAETTVGIAVATGANPAAQDFIEKGLVLPASGGVYVRSGLKVSPGERIILTSTGANTMVRVSGLLVTSL